MKNEIFDNMLSRYDLTTEQQKRNAIFEVNQQVILAGLYAGGFFESAAFYGGTCLRIFHGLQRFSEDMDFSLLTQDDKFDFTKYFPTEATSFEGKASDECLSPESAVTMAMMSLQDKMAEYFRINFPVTAKLMKILKAKNGVAEVILIKAGKKHGIKVGDRFNVESIEILDGEVLPTILGIVTVTALKGEAYTECKVGKKEGKVIYENFNANKQIKCSLIIK